MASKSPKESSSLPWLLVSLIGILAVPHNVSGANVKASNMKITIRIYNLADLPDSTVRTIGEEVSRIFGHAKISVDCLDCLQQELRLQCREPRTPADLMLRLVAVNASSRSLSKSRILGNAKFASQGSVIADVLCLPVDALPVMARTIPVRVLGHAAAHEIGHQLLGPASHHHQGIMRSRWGDDDFRKMAARTLFFTPEQAQTMRQALLARYERAQLAQK